MRIGLISDTHGRLPSEVFDHFATVDRILHAGDIGQAAILTDLAALAPVSAVWGNTDGFDLRSHLPETVELDIEGRRLLLVHGHQLGWPTADGLADAYPEFGIVVYGHTHRPAAERIRRRLFVNPGSAVAPRSGLRPSIALLELNGNGETIRLIEF